MLNSDSACNTKAEAALAACLNGGRLSHAILVEGPGDTLAFAKKIAAAVLCASAADKPCKVCRDCVKCERGIHPDLLVYSDGGKARSFHVDTVRELRQQAFIRPNEASGKVFILENAHNMTIGAQNALLKIIEEPPANVTFILTCENKAALLETVLSRATALTLDDIGPPGPEARELEEKAKHIIENLLQGSEFEALAAFAPYERERAGFGKLLAAIHKAAADRMIEAAKAGSRSETAKLMKLIDIADNMARALDGNVGGLLMTTMLPARFKLQ